MVDSQKVLSFARQFDINLIKNNNMKALVISKSLIVLAVTFICSLTVSAVSPRNYLYDTKEENGKVISKVIFSQEDGLLNKEVRYEFTYNDAGKVAEKKAYRWNKNSEEWEPYYLITYKYDNNGDINTVYGMWNKKKKDYSLNVQSMSISQNSYDTIFS